MTKERRVKKHSSALEDDATAHLWSVSYADLLMVMLSFFVLYFNPDEKKPPLPPPPPPPSHVAMMIEKIAPQLNHLFFGSAPTELAKASKEAAEGKADASGKEALSAKGASVAEDLSASSPGASGDQALTTEPGKELQRGAGSALGPDVVATESGSRQLPSALRDSILKKKLNIVLESQEDDLVIHFVADAYPPGAFDVTRELEKRLSELLSAIYPFKDGLVLTFIGHADSRPLSERLKKMVYSNMVLSSMRAAKAAEFAEKAGFDPHAILTEGTANYGRNSRTLTVRLSERPTK